MTEREIVALPSSELGDGRHVFLGLDGGHMDTKLYVWPSGANIEDPWAATRFSVAHGLQTNVFAALTGFLVRAETPEAEIQQIMLEAGKDLLINMPPRSAHHEGRWFFLATASGEPFEDSDIEELGLKSLGRPMPQAPGTVETSGGTGLYTRRTPTSTLLVVRKTHDEHESAEFCKEDVPTLARLACRLAIGDYRADFQDFIRERFLQPSQT